MCPQLVFCSPSGNTMKNRAAQLPFSKSHLDDSHPYGGGGRGGVGGECVHCIWTHRIKKIKNQFNTKEIHIYLPL